MPSWPTTPPLALGPGEFSLILLLLVAVVVPVAAIAFARSGKGLDELGKGTFAVDFAEESDGEREEELRQLVEARAWRRERRGEDPGDIEAEIGRLLKLGEEGVGKAGARDDPAGGARQEPVNPPDDGGLREEVRQVVVAKNESRLRRGEAPLDVEAEIERLLHDLI